MEIWMMNSQIPQMGKPIHDSIDPNEELVPIDEAPGMSAGEDVEGIE